MNLSKIISTAAAIILSAALIFCFFPCGENQNEFADKGYLNIEDPKEIDRESCFAHTYFLGDSNTAHLSHEKYFAVSGLVSQDRVWTGKGRTLTLDATVNVQDPKTGEISEISALAGRVRPEYLVITLGYNGFSNPVSGNSRESLNRLFISAYQKLINDIRAASPKTVIFIQSIFPVKKGSAVQSPEAVNERIDELNEFLRDIALANGLKYLDTQSVLRDPVTNCLKEEFSSLGSFYHTDGYHLSDTGLLAVLNYIKENAYE